VTDVCLEHLVDRLHDAIHAEDAREAYFRAEELASAARGLARSIAEVGNG
jgi:hypothetical protein